MMRFLVFFFASLAFGQVTHVITRQTLPATCKPDTGDIIFKTSAPKGLYDCPTTNTWRLIANGTPGPTGTGYAATSLTLVQIGVGLKGPFTLTSTNGAALAYLPGAYVGFYSAANPTVNFMEGTVSTFDGTNMTINVLVVGGSGFHADWNVSVAGRQGSGGPGPGLTLSTITNVQLGALLNTQLATLSN